MYRILFFLVNVFACTIAAAQTPKEDSVKTEIVKLSAEWNDALVKRDSLVLDRILASDFALGSANTSALPREQWMKNSLHVLVTDSAQFIGAQRITVFGNEAISEGTLHWKVRNKNKDGVMVMRNNEYLVADIWRFTNGRWQVTRRLSKLARKR